MTGNGAPPPGTGPLHALRNDDRFRLREAFGPGVLIDSGLPVVVFITVWTLSDQRLDVSLWAALGCAAVLAVIRLVRRRPLQNVLAGFLGTGLAAFVASRTGRAEDVFLPGLLANLGYAVAYTVSILVRWPLLGVFVGAITQQGMGWRKDPVQLRAYSLASWIWVGMFLVRLAVQVPLYLAGTDQLGWLATARLLMGWPLFFVCLYLSWVVIRSVERRTRDSASVG